MSTKTKSVIALIAASTALLLSACTSSEPPAVERATQGGQSLHPEIEDRHSVAWDTAEVRDEDTLVLNFPTAPEPTCQRHDVEVVENEEDVTVTLFAGELPDSERLCESIKILEMPGAYDFIVIKLDAPLGDREIIDGHAQ